MKSFYSGDGVIVEPKCNKIVIHGDGFWDDAGESFVLKIEFIVVLWSWEESLFLAIELDGFESHKGILSVIAVDVVFLFGFSLHFIF